MPITNQNLQMQPFAIGQQGTATFKPNWGQPIVDGQWQGQPQAAPDIDPRAVINTKLKELGDVSEAKYNRVLKSGLDPQVIERLTMAIQNEYDQAKAKLTGVASQLDLIQQSVGAGGMTQEAGREAGLRMIMPKEIVDLMFPSVRGMTPSAAGMAPGTANLLFNRWEDIGSDAIMDDVGWWRKRVNKDKLKKFFKQERTIRNLNDPRNVNEIPGFNEAFVRWVDSQPGGTEALDELFDEKTGDPDMIRWFSKLSETPEGRAFNNKADGVSPLGKGVWRLRSGTKKPYISPETLQVGTPWAPSQFYRTNERNVAKSSTGTKHQIGTVIQRGGKNYKVVGFDTDGTPMVEEAR